MASRPALLSAHPAIAALRSERAEGLRRAVYRVDLSRERFENEREAASRVRRLDFRADRPAHMATDYRYWQRDAGRGPWRSIGLDAGVLARLDAGSD